MSLRRLLLLILVIAASAASFKRIRDQRAAQTAAPPEWPPFEPRIVPRSPEQGRASVPGTDARPSAVDTWVVASADGTTPEGYPVKAKVSSGIFHVPGGRFYERTSADRCYPDAAAAQADGYRPSKS